VRPVRGRAVQERPGPAALPRPETGTPCAATCSMTWCSPCRSWSGWTSMDRLHRRGVPARRAAVPRPVRRYQYRAAPRPRPDLHYPRPPGAYRLRLVRRHAL